MASATEASSEPILINNCSDALSDRPYLHMYSHSDEVEELAVVNLNGVNLERQVHIEQLLGVRFFFKRPKT